MPSAPVHVWLEAWKLCRGLYGEGVARMSGTAVGDRDDLVMDMTLSVVEFYERYRHLSEADFWVKFRQSWLWRGGLRFARRAPYRVGDDPRPIRRCEMEPEEMEEVSRGLWEPMSFDPERMAMLRESMASWQRRPTMRERDTFIACCDPRF